MALQSRTLKDSSCKECSIVGSSKVERKFFEQFRSFDQKALNGTKLPFSFLSQKSLSVDILFTFADRRVAVEYDSVYWHLQYKDRSKADFEKTQVLLDNGFTVVRIRDEGLPLVDIKHENLIQVRFNPFKPDVVETVDEIMGKLASL